MTFHDDFMQELLVIMPIVKSLHEALGEDLPEHSQFALESACATLSTRALEIIEGIVSDAQAARPKPEGAECPNPTISSTGSISLTPTTDPANTSSQPAPVDLANAAQSPKLGL
jgi:hypothetical protein